ncbi:hypothetical protein SeLEV6574_g03768 [Synchytrium endobioticum]|uniref:CCDC66 domain-containing protein n=1 Tax=Synchytrium endobioticum TaxID=286115 RepID=A0A507D2X2_9FUNG|nr:hypothetical protein SeLEV6574_g03768 [Synchytrium endobioticum]
MLVSNAEEERRLRSKLQQQRELQSFLDSQKNVNPRFRHLREPPSARLPSPNASSALPPLGVSNIDQPQLLSHGDIHPRVTNDLRLPEQRQNALLSSYRPAYAGPTVDCTPLLPRYYGGPWQDQMQQPSLSLTGMAQQQAMQWAGRSQPRPWRDESRHYVNYGYNTNVDGYNPYESSTMWNTGGDARPMVTSPRGPHRQAQHPIPNWQHSQHAQMSQEIPSEEGDYHPSIRLHQGILQPASRSYADELRMQIAEQQERKIREKQDRFAHATSNTTRSRQPPASTYAFGDQSLIAGTTSLGSPRMNQNGPARVDPAQKAQYLRELDDQVRLKKHKEFEEKGRQRQEDLKKEREIADYNPWGKGGAGAPYRTADGTIITSKARKLITEGVQLDQIPMPPSGPVMVGAPVGDRGVGFLDALRNLHSPVEDGPGRSNNATSANEHSHVRGLVNIDTLPSWQRDEYIKKHREKQSVQDGLRKQMEERAALKAQEEEKRRSDDEREAQRIEKEREILKQQYAKESEAARKKLEEDLLEKQKQIAEKAAAKRNAQQSAAPKQTLNQVDEPLTRVQAARKRAEEARKAVTSEGQNQPVQKRAPSPPIPALRSNYSPLISTLRPTQAVPSASLPANSPSTSPPLPTMQSSAHLPTVKNGSFNGRTVESQHDVPRQRANNAETQAVLQQLSCIQKDLEIERMKMQQELQQHAKSPPVARRRNTPVSQDSADLRSFTSTIIPATSSRLVENFGKRHPPVTTRDLAFSVPGRRRERESTSTSDLGAPSRSEERGTSNPRQLEALRQKESNVISNENTRSHGGGRLGLAGLFAKQDVKADDAVNNLDRLPSKSMMVPLDATDNFRPIDFEVCQSRMQTEKLRGDSERFAGALLDLKVLEEANATRLQRLREMEDRTCSSRDELSGFLNDNSTDKNVERISFGRRASASGGLGSAESLPPLPNPRTNDASMKNGHR